MTVENRNATLDDIIVGGESEEALGLLLRAELSGRIDGQRLFALPLFHSEYATARRWALSGKDFLASAELINSAMYCSFD